jgi:hypothetical protein
MYNLLDLLKIFRINAPYAQLADQAIWNFQPNRTN